MTKIFFQHIFLSIFSCFLFVQCTVWPSKADLHSEWIYKVSLVTICSFKDIFLNALSFYKGFFTTQRRRYRKFHQQFHKLHEDHEVYAEGQRLFYSLQNFLKSLQKFLPDFIYCSYSHSKKFNKSPKVP